MANCVFASGERLRMDGAVYFMRRKISGDRWQLENEFDGELVNMPEDELHKLYREQRLSFMVNGEVDVQDLSDAVSEKIQRDFSDYPEKVRLIAEKRLKYVRAIEKVPRSDDAEKIRRVAEKIKDLKPPSLSAVRAWLSRFKKKARSIIALIPGYASQGNKKPRYPEELTEIAVEQLRRVYLTEERGSLTDTLSAIRHEVRQRNKQRPSHKHLPIPSRKFLRKLVNDMDEYEKMRSRYGKPYADRYFRKSLHSGEEEEYQPLGRVEIDHTVLDLIVVNSKTYVPLGRPTITVALDRRTRCIHGYYVSFEPASYIQVMKCLEHAILSKNYMRSKYPDIKSTWPCWGIPEQIVVDNGPEFHSRDFEEAALSMLMEVRYCPVRQPWWKGSIERYFRTLNSQLIHTIPGTTFSDPEEKKEYQSTKKAIITQDVLDELLHTWICDVYHNTVHRSILHTPAALWRELIDSTTQRLPESYDVLKVMLGSVETRTLFGYGINLNNLTYASDELHNLFRRKGEMKVKIRWNRSDLGHIYVLDEQSNSYFEVPCTKLKYASGVSLWLHQAIRREALRLYGEEHQAALDAAKAHLKSICEKAMRSKRQRTRKVAARVEKGLRVGEETQPETQSLEIPMQVVIPEATGGNSISPVWEDVANDDIPCFEVV